MSTFDAEWLALREAYDLPARSDEVEQAFMQALPNDRVRVMDLASGSGATVTALSHKLVESGRTEQNWTLADFDAGLLTRAVERHSGKPGLSVNARTVNLATDLSTLPYQDVDAVTASAFFDLVSHEFIVELVGHLARHRLPLLASLTYDGRTSWTPHNGADAMILGAFNQHQTGNKGFGAALGPNAPLVLTSELERAGYRVIRQTSDWVIPTGHVAMQTALLAGWQQVAVELEIDPEICSTWCAERQRQMEGGELSIIVGHVDLCALPAN